MIEAQHWKRVHFLEWSRKSIVDPRSQCIKGIDKSTLGKVLVVPLMHFKISELSFLQLLSEKCALNDMFFIFRKYLIQVHGHQSNVSTTNSINAKRTGLLLWTFNWHPVNFIFEIWKDVVEGRMWLITTVGKKCWKYVVQKNKLKYQCSCIKPFSLV